MVLYTVLRGTVILVRFFALASTCGKNLDSSCSPPSRRSKRTCSGFDRPDADAIFISCGALRSIDVVDALERQLGKPVICSNQAMMWDMLRLAGVEDRIEGYGRLLRDH